jgi:hypothetical protein
MNRGKGADQTTLKSSPDQGFIHFGAWRGPTWFSQKYAIFYTWHVTSSVLKNLTDR